MTVFVTGGAGFIGSNFILYFMKRYPGYRVVCIDKLTEVSNLKNLDTVRDNPNFRFEKLDICDRDNIFKLFEEENPDTVINFAAESHVDRSIESADIFIKTNVSGVQILLDACVKYNAHFHQISTDEVYGELHENGEAFSEESTLNPGNPYSASKAAADMLVMAYRKTYNLKATISRSSNNYGDFQHPEKFIPKSVTNAVKGEKISLYGDGKNIRDWIYVSDHCRAIDVIIHNGKDGEIYNVGAQNERQNIDILKDICKILKVSEDLITYVPDRKGHDLRYAINPQKIKSLGWKAEMPFDEGLEKTVKWYVNHPNWWQKEEK